MSISFEPKKNIFHTTIIAKSWPMKFVMWGNKKVRKRGKRDMPWINLSKTRRNFVCEYCITCQIYSYVKSFTSSS